MNEKPILFNTEMVVAILEGRKTQTRRPLKPQPKNTVFFYNTQRRPSTRTALLAEYQSPYFKDDLLYVRETWAHNFYDEDLKKWHYWYKADCPTFPEDAPEGWIFGGNHPDKWRPSIHMPKEAARIWLRVKDVSVQRISAMSDEDAKAEGVLPIATSYKAAFFELWKKLYGWDNTIAWVIEFERIEK